MPSVEISKPLSESCTSFEPVKEKRLELGKKVFKVPTESKRKSSRIQRPEAASSQGRKKATVIVHHLLLAPTLKRQRKKKLEREKRTRASREWKWDFNTKSENDIKLSDIFTKKRNRSRKRLRSGQTFVHRILEDNDAPEVRKKEKVNDSAKIRRLARCGGVKYVSGLGNFNDERIESNIPPPFEAMDDDPFIPPTPGQLISYLWHSRPSPVLGEKNIYRTGILCSNDGLIRFFEDDDDSERSNDENRKFYEARFYLNKQVFKKGDFRVRTDLVVGAICYERERKIPCKIIKIDEKCGAVLVERLEAKDGATNQLWISPDDLVGNYKVSKVSNAILDDARTHRSSNPKTCEQRGQISPICVDLTEEDENESHPGLIQSLAMYQKSNGLYLSPKPELRRGPRNLAEISPEVETPRYLATGSSSQTLYPGSTSLAEAKALVADVCKSLSTISGVPNNGYTGGRDFRRQDLHLVQNEQSLQVRTQPTSLRFQDENLIARANPNITSNIVPPITPDASFRAQTLSDRYTMMACSSSPLSQNNVAVQSKLDLLKQHGMALELLMSASDLGTIVATLQYIKRMHQRGIPVGPTAAKLVSEAEMTSRVLMEDSFLKHLTTPVWSGGKGYDVSHAGVILCRLTPILGPNLGRLDSPTIDSTKLLSLGLNTAEVLDILPYIQSFEDDILMKTLSFKRKIANVY